MPLNPQILDPQMLDPQTLDPQTLDPQTPDRWKAGSPLAERSKFAVKIKCDYCFEASELLS
jgi:hypothetical protein